MLLIWAQRAVHPVEILAHYTNIFQTRFVGKEKQELDAERESVFVCVVQMSTSDSFYHKILPIIFVVAVA